MSTYARRRTASAVLVVALTAVTPRASAQQAPATGEHAHEAHDATQIEHEHEGTGTPAPDHADGSGTSWLPGDSPMYALHQPLGSWALMVHGNVFVQFLEDGGNRGASQWGSINWVMAEVSHDVGDGNFTAVTMLSAEPWTIRGCGYPDLLATGELCGGTTIHDRQHPHDLLMEVAVDLDHPIGKGINIELYGGPAGEPALGPPAFMHRLSALSNPIAPMSHHWFDSTHIVYGVVTAGVHSGRWKLEGSAFNGREPDEDRVGFELAALDSWSTRLSFAPTPSWALQVSGGSLTDAEALEDGGRESLTRTTASATYHRRTPMTLWATTLGWGRNAHDGTATHAALVETSVTRRDRNVLYSRFEWTSKTGHDLGLVNHDIVESVKLQGGFTHYFRSYAGLTPGAGATAQLSIVPRDLETIYGGRMNPGFGVYLTLRPAGHHM
jgi:hypothetical protein